MKKFAVLFAAALLSLASCDLFSPPEDGGSGVAVTGISFAKTALSVNIGTDEYLALSIKPENAQNKVKLKWEYDGDAISINPDSYGVVISGLKPQSTYVKASAGGYSATCIINVTDTSGSYIGDPYIYAGSGIIEIQPMASQNISVSLMGGSAADYSDFAWATSDGMVADINAAMNNCVVRSFKTGTAQITASHPNSKYPYTFIVHSYSDDFSEPYLTTNTNIVTINKTESAVKNISVSLKNSVNGAIVSRYRWEIDSGGGEPCISLAGNGDTAVITGLSSGLARVKISHDECGYPLYILIRVTAAVANVYVTTSVSTLEITGSAYAYTVTADVAGYSGFVDKSKFVWTLPDDADSYADCRAHENSLTVTGKYNGAFKARVTHELSDFARTVLVVLREQDGSRIDNSIYITTDKNYVQTKIGADTVPISVALIGGGGGDENNFVWTVDGGQDNLFVRFETTHGSIKPRAAFGSLAQGVLYITPRSAGSATVSVSHPKASYSTDISVRVYSEFAQLEEPLYISCPAAFLKKLGGTSERLSATLSGGAAPGDEDSVSWASSDRSLVSFAPGTGTETMMSVAYGQGKKQSYITVSHPNAQSSKRILLLSADTQQELDSMKALYADQAYYRTNAGSTVSVPISAFGLEPHDVIDWSASPNGIVLVNKNNSDQLSASVAGISSGLVTVTARIRNADAAPCEITFAVLPEGEDTGTISARFISTAKNAVLLQEIGSSAELSVYGVNIQANDLYQAAWSGYDQSIISVAANGASAAVTALNYGSTRIKVSHPLSAIDLFIDVKIGALYSWVDELYPYITVESDVVLMVKGDKNKTIGASLVNHQAAGGFSFRLSPPNSPIASITGSQNGVCVIDALEAGMCEIAVSNIYSSCDREILLVVGNSPEELAGFNYLTTSQNVITIPSGSPATVSVSVPNIASPPSGSFSWESSDPAVASIVSSGHFAVVTGVKTGTAIITVLQQDCLYPLEIIANVVDPKLAASNPYIMSPNIITLRVGDPLSSIAAELIGGFPADNAHFNWSCTDPSMIDLYGSNETAQARAKREGIAQIRISHPKSAAERGILVICEPKLAVDYSITVSENIVRLSPSDNARAVTATLVNGTQADVHGFKWWADSYDIIDFNYTGNTCVVTPKSTGSTYIHVSHPKSSYARDILIQISQFSEFKFALQSMSVAAGAQTFVNMQAPLYNFTARVDYEAVDPVSGASASHIVTASGTNSVCTVSAHSPGSAVLRAKLVNASNGAVQATAQLLVSVTPSSTPSTYINYTGPTIITVEKGVTRQLSAALAGLGAAPSDNGSLQWKAGDWFNRDGFTVNPNRAVNISPTPSASGTAVNGSIQITGLNDGTECTITVSHEKSNSSVVLYVIVPGSTAANVSLSTGSARYCIVGDPAFTLSASVTNPQKDDYETLKWELEQAGDVVNMSGSGKNISVLPKNPGTAVITATVPSSRRHASVAITVEPQRHIALEYSRANTFPGQALSFSYSVSPPELIDCVSWDVSDTRLVRALDNAQTGIGHNGTMQVMGMQSSGAATVTAALHPRDNKNIVLATASMTVKNGWDNIFSINKTSIRHIPVKPDTPSPAQNPFTVAYEVSPYSAEVRVTIPDPGKLRLAAGSYSEIRNGHYIIKQDKLYKKDSETGAGYGYIQLEPLGECKQDIQIQAYNPLGLNPATGEPAPYFFPDTPRTVECNIAHSSYSFDIAGLSLLDGGKYSLFDPSIGAIVIGDGETVEFFAAPIEQNASPVFPSNGSFTKNANEKITDYNTWLDSPYFNSLYSGSAAKENVYRQGNQITVTKIPGYENKYRITHGTDYKGSGTPWAMAAADPGEDSNATQVGFILAGTLEIPYRVFGSIENKTAAFRVYVSIRNCPYSYKP